MRIIVTGGAGFIGSNLIAYLLSKENIHLLNIDKLCFPGVKRTIEYFEKYNNYNFVQADICDLEKIPDILSEYKPDAIMHLAAESHVDRSIESPENFIQSNIVGTFSMLEVARRYWSVLKGSRAEQFRFHHISTDEVFGSLDPDDQPCIEHARYDPSSPYSASKASADHLVRAWHRTYSLPVLISNCTNNYGPYQFPEKLIPLIIMKALKEQSLPVYGNGSNIRDWLYVQDHVEALFKILTHGSIGESYNISGLSEKTNIEVVNMICHMLDRLKPRPSDKSYKELITFVTDRPGHDFRYALDSSKVKSALGWTPRYDFENGLNATVKWYLNNIDWCESVTESVYDGSRIGLIR